MNGFNHRLVLLIACVLLSLSVSSSAATAAHWMIVIQPARLVNGSPVLFRVTAPKAVRTLSGNWLGHELTFNFDASRKISWFAFAGSAKKRSRELTRSSSHAET